MLRTRIWAEGMGLRLADVRVNRTIAAGQTIKQAVETIWDNDVRPRTRIRHVAATISGSFTLVGQLVFDCNAWEALRTLALIQGSTEYGVTEAGQLYFHAEGTADSDDGHVILGQNVPEMAEQGSVEMAWNRVTAYGRDFVSATGNNVTNQTAYGIREMVVHFPWVANAATDLQRLADNVCNAEAAGQNRLYGWREGPTARLEEARPNTVSTSFTAQGKFSFWGIDGVKAKELPEEVRYRYHKASPTRFYAEAWAGHAREGLQREVRRLMRSVHALLRASERLGTLAGNHNLLSATHLDTVAASVVRGDLVSGNSTPAWARLALGGSGTVLRSNGSDALYSTFTIPDTYVAGDIIYASADNVLSALAIGSAATVLTVSGGVPTWAAAASGEDFYGDGSDGDVTISVNTTLSRDMFYDNLTVNTGITLSTGGYRIFVKTKLTITGTGSISAAGGAGGNGSGTTGGSAGAAGGAVAGGVNVRRPFLANGAVGGAGGNGGGIGSSNGAAGAAGGALAPFNTRVGALSLCSGGGGGGGGGHGSAPTAGGAGGQGIGTAGGAGGTGVSIGNADLGGGGGGGGGGVVLVFSEEIDNAGTITAKGGAGGNGQTSMGRDSGNGGGGGGGAVIVYYTTASGSGLGTLSALGGAAGTGGTGGSTGGDGTTHSQNVLV